MFTESQINEEYNHSILVFSFITISCSYSLICTTRIRYGEWTNNEFEDGNFEVTTDHVRYNIQYTITHGTINEITPFCEVTSIVIQILPEKEGILSFILPRDLLDAKIENGEDGKFFVLLDGEEICFEEVRHHDSREITIEFTSDSKEIEIIGTFLLAVGYGPIACEIVHNPPYSHILPPLKQMKNGVTSDGIVCKDNFSKVFKQLPGHVEKIACIKPSSTEKLQERGWLDYK